MQSRLNDWYVNSETLALEASLSQVTKDMEHVTAMGFSMGGYAVFRLARALNLRSLLSLSPQFSISEQHVPFDRRFEKWAAEFDPELGALKACAYPLRGLILVDPFNRADLINARMIKEVFPTIEIARLAFGGHPATSVLSQAGRYSQLQKMLLKDRFPPKKIIRVHRGARRKSKRYWTRLAAAASKTGRSALEFQAMERLEALKENRVS